MYEFPISLILLSLQKAMYSIVKFIDENLVELVPQKWLKSPDISLTQCWFPAMGASDKVKRLIGPLPETGAWYDVKVLGTYGKFI